MGPTKLPNRIRNVRTAAAESTSYCTALGEFAPGTLKITEKYVEVFPPGI
jgi:hypothetical protein